MEGDYSEDNRKYIKAKKRVAEIKGFYVHAVVIALVIPFLIFINYKTYWGYQWFWYPLAAGALSVVIHGFVVKGNNSDWEERKIRELMEKDESNY